MYINVVDSIIMKATCGVLAEQFIYKYAGNSFSTSH